MHISKQLQVIIAVVVVALVLLFVFRSCQQVEIKHKSTDDKSKFSLELERKEPRNNQ